LSPQRQTIGIACPLPLVGVRSTFFSGTFVPEPRWPLRASVVPWIFSAEIFLTPLSHSPPASHCPVPLFFPTAASHTHPLPQKALDPGYPFCLFCQQKVARCSLAQFLPPLFSCPSPFSLPRSSCFFPLFQLTLQFSPVTGLTCLFYVTVCALPVWIVFPVPPMKTRFPPLVTKGNFHSFFSLLASPLLFGALPVSQASLRINGYFHFSAFFACNFVGNPTSSLGSS